MWTYEFDVRQALTWHQVISVEATTEDEAREKARETLQERLEDLQGDYSVDEEGDPSIALNVGGPPPVDLTTVLLHKNQGLDATQMIELALQTGYPYVEVGGQVFHVTEKVRGQHTGYKVVRGRCSKLDVQDVKMPNLDL